VRVGSGVPDGGGGIMWDQTHVIKIKVDNLGFESNYHHRLV
jgi:hypothetical protein